jgi:hypothetical protein
MFGAYLRAGLTIGVAVLSAAVLQFIVPYLLPFVGATGVEESNQTMLYSTFAAIADNALLIMLAAIAAGVLTRAVVESGPGGI